MSAHTFASCVVVLICTAGTGFVAGDCEEDSEEYLQVKSTVHTSARPSNTAVAKASSVLARAYDAAEIAKKARRDRDEAVDEDVKITKDLTTLVKMAGEARAARAKADASAQQHDKESKEAEKEAKETLTAMVVAKAKLIAQKKVLGEHIASGKRITEKEANALEDQIEDAARMARTAKLLFKSEHDLENQREMERATAKAKAVEESQKKQSIKALGPQLRGVRLQRDEASKKAEQAEIHVVQLNRLAGAVISEASRTEQLLAGLDADPKHADGHRAPPRA